MPAKIGIPRTLFYYYYYPFIDKFFAELDVELVLSPPTSRMILDIGVREALTDACVPIKIYFGHIHYLKDKVDYLFIPRIVSLNAKNIYCPKFLGLPDMIKSTQENMPEVIETLIDCRNNHFAIFKAFYTIGSKFTKNKFKIIRAYIKSLITLKQYQKYLKTGLTPQIAMQKLQNITSTVPPLQKGNLTFAVLGYPYIVHDPYINFNMLEKLNKLGVKAITIEQLPKNYFKTPSNLPKGIFWTFSSMVLNSFYHIIAQENYDGIIHLTAFGCGPDSIVDKYMELESKNNSHTPFMSITIDEQSGEAGIYTRLEAFVDLVKRRKEMVK